MTYISRRHLLSFGLALVGPSAIRSAWVAEVYVSDSHAKVERPSKELKGFEKVSLAAGETKHVSVPLDARAFAYWDVETRKWKIAPGKFTIVAGDSVESESLKGNIEISDVAAETAQFQ
ncbi:MAG: fibronectin type III-like domain-contianing protein [Acidobacteriaceae bacterium]|nr:fibronectin type III-like domain-contianing protein [Acidobacteriaceae bacterium]